MLLNIKIFLFKYLRVFVNIRGY